MDRGAWWAAVHGVAKSQTWLSNFPFIFHFHALEKEMATHSSVLAWRIPGTGEAWWAAVYGSHRVGHDWSNLAAAAVAAVVVVRSLPSLSPGFILLYSFLVTIGLLYKFSIVLRWWKESDGKQKWVKVWGRSTQKKGQSGGRELNWKKIMIGIDSIIVFLWRMEVSC